MYQFRAWVRVQDRTRTEPLIFLPNRTEPEFSNFKYTNYKKFIRVSCFLFVFNRCTVFCNKVVFCSLFNLNLYL